MELWQAFGVLAPTLAVLLVWQPALVVLLPLLEHLQLRFLLLMVFIKLGRNLVQKVSLKLLKKKRKKLIKKLKKHKRIIKN
jgi:hypothetical protein